MHQLSCQLDKGQMTGTPRVSSSEWDGSTQSYDKSPIMVMRPVQKREVLDEIHAGKLWGCGGVLVAGVC
jgi:hypothetical protein